MLSPGADENPPRAAASARAPRRAGTALLLAAALAGAIALVATAATPRQPQPQRSTAACGTRSGPPAVYSHVIWIWFENHRADQIIGNPAAPAINSLAQRCGLATDYSAITHPSLPNYVAATTGGTQGIADDDPPSSHPLSVDSIFGQAPSAASYQESMPSNCLLTSSGEYAVKHNPEAYLLPVRAACGGGDVPLGTPARGALRTALKKGTLPAFAFVTPNLCNDMHDCSVATGDAWLQSWLPVITSSTTYRAGRTAVFVTWDEDDSSGSNRVATIVVSPYTHPGVQSATAFTHYSLLRTTEELLGISTHLGNAASAASMRAAFGL